MMTAKFAELGGLHQEIDLNAGRYSDYEKLLEETNYPSIRFLLSAICASRSIARIGPDRNTAYGTGFLINPEWINSTGGRALFLTNAHICSDSPKVRKYLPSTLSPENSTLVFTDFSDSRTRSVSVRVIKQIWTSPPDELDATLLEIDSPPQFARPLSQTAAAPAPGQPQSRVNIIGYPRGLDMRVSMHSNEVIDLRHSCLYYRTPSESGSSGSPVFDMHWNVVAMHQGTMPARQTNVGICINSIVEAI
jgi:V8-like Glu-specific endopeptidase